MDFASTLLALRSDVHAAVVSVSADTPLVAAAVDAVTAQQDGNIGGQHVNSTPLEAAQAAFVVGLAHVADWVLSLRLLDTGFAADVSGVLRITRGDNSDKEEEEEGDVDVGSEELKMEEKEVLYYIGGDGSAKAFERGSGVGNG